MSWSEASPVRLGAGRRVPERHVDRRRVLGAGLALLAGGVLAGCGFRPLYGQRGVTGGSTADTLAQIRVTPIADRTGQLLYNDLRDRLNPRGKPGDPLYVLDIALEEISRELAFRGDETPTRANLRLEANYVLREAVADSPDEPAAVITAGQSRITTAYDIVESQFATIVSIDDARARAVEALTEDIAARLAIALSAAGAAAGPAAAS